MTYAFVISFAISMAFLLRNRESHKAKMREVHKTSSSSWLEYQIARDKAQDDLMDTIYNNKYRFEINQAAIEKLTYWMDLSTSADIMIPMTMGKILYVGHNHKEVFGNKSYEELVQEKYLELRSKEYTPEEILAHDKKREEYFYRNLGLEPR